MNPNGIIQEIKISFFISFETTRKRWYDDKLEQRLDVKMEKEMNIIYQTYNTRFMYICSLK